MKNTKLYYIIQTGIVAISIVTFMNFTYPYLISSQTSTESKKPTKEFSDYLKDLEIGGPSRDRDVGTLSEKPEKKVSKPLPSKTYKKISPYVSATPHSPSSAPSSESRTPPLAPTPTKSEIEEINKKIDLLKESINKKPKVEEMSALDKIEHFFKLSSSVVGTIFPIVGFTMTVMLWRNQRKEKKLKTAEV